MHDMKIKIKQAQCLLHVVTASPYSVLNFKKSLHNI
jgi:hypothetical protein